MTETISKFVLRTLCDHRGCLDFQSLHDKIAQSFTVAEQVLRVVFADDGRITVKEGTKKASGAQIISPDSLVLAKTSLRLCQKKPGDCPRCDGLHLCRYYVCGECTFGLKCKNPHGLDSPYNAELLKRHGLHDLTEKQLFQLLLQNDPCLLPEICSHYNKGNGPHGSCKFTSTCTKLHVCQHHFQGDCKFGSSCKRAHNIEANAMKMFKGFSADNIRNLNEIYRNRCIIVAQQDKCVSPVSVVPEVRIPAQVPHRVSGSPTSSSPPSKPMSDADRHEICLYFIRRHCSFKDKCARVHWHLPYRWQVLDSDGVTWNDLPNMEDIEKAYCDPGNDTSCVDTPAPPTGLLKYLTLSFPSPAPPDAQGVDFMKMRFDGSPVRRLSTPSSITKPPHYILTTQWLWYWKAESGDWLEFGQGDGGEQASVTSQTLENVYLADRDAEIPFSAGKQQYVLHFKDAQDKMRMFQQNLKYKTKREVRRRPRFVSAHDVEAQLKSTSSQSSLTAENFPANWDKSALPEFGYKLLPLSTTGKDYKMIEMLFKRTMPHSEVKKIQRIQNPSLWKVFHWQKEQMKGRNGGRAVDEKYLFHGTDESLIEAICDQNFDWRMCGVHGTAYGKGSYFARDASYSDRYSKVKGNMNKIMFVALVLVGEYTRGRSSFVRPPPKADNRTFYDSCVDSESSPSIFVIFDKQQIYPEFLINYS